MKAVYILLVIVLAAAALGCVGKKGPETSTKIPVTHTPTPQPANTPQPSNTVSGSEVLDTNNDLTNMDTMFDESNLDISFSDVSAEALT